MAHTCYCIGILNYIFFVSFVIFFPCNRVTEWHLFRYHMLPAASAIAVEVYTSSVHLSACLYLLTSLVVLVAW